MQMYAIPVHFHLIYSDLLWQPVKATVAVLPSRESPRSHIASSLGHIPSKYFRKSVFGFSKCFFFCQASIPVSFVWVSGLSVSQWISMRSRFKATPYPLKYLPQCGQVGQGSVLDTPGYLALSKELKSCWPTSVPMRKPFALKRDCRWLRVSP